MSPSVALKPAKNTRKSSAGSAFCHAISPIYLSYYRAQHPKNPYKVLLNRSFFRNSKQILRAHPCGGAAAALLWIAVFLFSSTSAIASNESPRTFAYQGKITDLVGNPLLDTITIKVGIYSPSGTCLLYEESQAGIDTTTTAGVFSIDVGSNTGAAKRTGSDPGLTMATIFSNQSTVIRAPGANCAGGYTSAPGDARALRFTFTPSSTGIPETLSPDQVIGATSQAWVAETLQGIGPTGFLQPNAGSGLSQVTLQQLTSGGDIGSSLHTHDSLYLKAGSGASQNAGSGGLYTSGAVGVGVAVPAAGAQLQVVDSAANQVGVTIKGAAAQTAALQQWLKSDGTVLASVDSAGVFTGSGSSLTSLNASSISSGSLPDARLSANVCLLDTANSFSNVNTFSNSSGGIVLSPYGAAAGNTSEVRFSELAANGAQYVGFKAPDSIATSKVWTLPNVDGGAGDVLKTNGSGVLSWVANGVGSVTSVTASSPLSSSGGTTPNLTISQADTTTNGFLSSADWTTFNSKIDGKANLTNAGALLQTASSGTAKEAAGFTIGSTANVTQLTVKAGSSQAANDLGDWLDNSNAILYSLNSSGTPTAGTDLATRSYVASAISTSNANYLPLAGGTMTGALNLHTPVSADALAQILVSTGADASKGLVVQGHSATQSANLQEWQGSNGTALASVDHLGNFSATSITGTLNVTNLSGQVSSAHGGTGQDSSAWTGVPSVSGGTWSSNSSLPVTLGGTGLTSTTINQILYSSANNTVSGLVTANNGVLITSGAGVPSISSTLPSTVQGNITSTGTITSGTWTGTKISEAYGGTNQSTYTTGDILYASGANTLSKLAGNTTATKEFLSQTGTGAASQSPSWSTVSKSDVGLGNVENTTLSTWGGSSNITTLGTVSTGVWHGTAVGVPYGGTGLSATPSDGELLIGQTSTNSYVQTTLTGTANRVTVTNGSGTITLSGPQDLATSSTVQFGKQGIGTSTFGTAAVLEVNPTITTDNSAAAQVTTAADANKGLVVQGHSATQTGNLQEWQKSDGTAVGSISPAGNLSASGNLTVTGTSKLGSTGVAVTAMGACTVASYTPTGAVATKTCTGVPASTAVAVTCSASAAFQSPNTTAIYARSNGVGDQIVVNLTNNNNVAVSLTCMWIQP